MYPQTMDERAARVLLMPEHDLCLLAAAMVEVVMLTERGTPAGLIQCQTGIDLATVLAVQQRHASFMAPQQTGGKAVRRVP